MIDTASTGELRHRDVYDATGSRIGAISEVYLDDRTGLPEWVTVPTGLFGTKETFVPLRDAELTTDGLRVPVGKDVVEDAPRIDPDGRLSPAEERELYRYYGLEGGLDGGLERDDVVAERRHEAQVSGPLDPPEAQRNVAAPAADKPLLRRYGH